MITSEADALAAAQSVAARLKEDVVRRDIANENPVAEVQLLRVAGLLPILVPAELGGGGLDWPTVLRVIRPIVRADASIGHVLAYHYLNSWRTVLNDRADRVEALWADTARNEWFWGGAGNPRDEGLVLTPDGDGFRVSGRKFFATGASVADRITASGTVAGTGEKLAIVLDGRAEGVTHPLDWQNMGQRLSASGSVTFENAAVPAAHVLGASDQEGAGYRPFASLSILFFQLLLSHLHVGIAEGAIETASDYARTATKPWPTSGVDSALKDPYILGTLGELVAATRASDALVARATDLAAAAVARGWDLTDEERGELAVEIGAAKVNSTRTVLDVTSRAFELTGARATTTAHGFDRFWRNARTITLHDPVVYKAKELGEHALTGAYPTPSKYS
ncbi:acyl-CoA dehydrogenase family protein [Naasia aerilata]|uniref:FMNH2-dependent monooxygenase n=1 Tax=Naasia aerilata TaxID=1162966 RepID=A0ABN6XQV0_9MICO|nr:acyl-CoA dehydrogenase family protein [Naasia aerilata]BDZ46010.1 FMNH2-dependent monooxygenase [Naasia aerilata]